MRTTTALALLPLLCVAACGCGGGDRPYPVEFRVTVDGQPAAGATVVLHPVRGTSSGSHRPTGKADENGIVRVSTFADGDGALPGEYAITAVWFDVTSTPEQAVVVKGGDKLKGRYASPDSPDAPRVTVQRQPNKLPPLDL